MTKTLLILGAGGHGKVVAEAALLSGQWKKVVFADDRWPELTMSFGYPVICNFSTIQTVKDRVGGAIVAVGNNKIRESWQSKLNQAGIEIVTIIHPMAHISSSSVIGKGSVILALSVIGAGARVGAGCIVNANSCVDHDAELADYSHLGVGVNLAGGVKVGYQAWLQAGCAVGYNVSIADFKVFSPGTALSID